MWMQDQNYCGLTFVPARGISGGGGDYIMQKPAQVQGVNHVQEHRHVVTVQRVPELPRPLINAAWLRRFLRLVLR